MEDGVFTSEGYGETVTIAQVFWLRAGDAAGQPDRLYVTAASALSIRPPTSMRSCAACASGRATFPSGMDSVEVVPVDDILGRRAGVLLSRSGGSDAIEAAVVCLAQDGDDILTSDPSDLLGLTEAAGVHVELIPV